MNWRRGLFRIWIVVSIFWAAFTAWRFYGHVYLPYERGVEVAAERDACSKKGRPNCGPLTFDDLMSAADIAAYSAEALAPVAAGCAFFVMAWVMAGFREVR
jgi:hypothetical protein